MIHLDIKSTNLMLTRLATGQLQVKLLDFGLATVMGQTVRVTGTISEFHGSPQIHSRVAVTNHAGLISRNTV